MLVLLQSNLPLHTLQVQQGLDAFRSLSITQLVDLSFHNKSNCHPCVVILGFTFPLAKVTVPFAISIAISSFLWSMISSSNWNMLHSSSTCVYILSAITFVAYHSIVPYSLVSKKGLAWAWPTGSPPMPFAHVITCPHLSSSVPAPILSSILKYLSTASSSSASGCSSTSLSYHHILLPPGWYHPLPLHQCCHHQDPQALSNQCYLHL